MTQRPFSSRHSPALANETSPDPARNLGLAVACSWLVLVVLTVIIVALPAHAAPEKDFTAGNIISDANFYNPHSMTANQIQQFFDGHSCQPQDDAPCLSHVRLDTPSTPESPGHCAAIAAHKKEQASAVIAGIANACTISPRVLLVLVQKEQSLVTRPSTAGYQKATGYACPDTAACDTRYFGLFNQVYRAAWQFREYTLNPEQWRYRIGVNEIHYHPDSRCGSSRVMVDNQATANLYNYTPYQPNAETLAHPDGPAGACSAYGNLNFFRIFSTWFGDPRFSPTNGFIDPCLSYTDGRACPTISPFSTSNIHS